MNYSLGKETLNPSYISWSTTALIRHDQNKDGQRGQSIFRGHLPTELRLKPLNGGLMGKNRLTPLESQTVD